MELTKGFIAQTANDYAMSIEDVESIAKRSNNYDEFYSNLEGNISTRGAISC